MGHEHGSDEITNQSSATVHGAHVQIGHNHGGIVFACDHAAQAGRAKPDQIPRARSFVNRSAEFASLDGWLDQHTRADEDAVGLLSGLPGVGKTATACEWAHRARDRFPDGQVFVDFAALRRHQIGGDLAEAAAWCLRALGVAEDYLPSTLAERLALYRSQCAGRRLLIVLDDVTEPGHISALAPGSPGSAVLATSTAVLGELSLDGARLLALAPLDRVSGARLLARLAGAGAGAFDADPHQAERLVDLCGGLPVALRVVAARLNRHRWLTPATLADELADESDRLAALSGRSGGSGVAGDKESSVSGAFNLAYRDLSAGQGRLYRLLGLLPYPLFDAGTVAAALRLAPSAARRGLDELVEAGLLQPEPDDRYRLHSLVRLHARALAEAEDDPEQRTAVPARVLAHYLQLSALADRAIRADRLRVADLGALVGTAPDPFADGTRSPLAWLEAERPALLAVLREAERYGWDRPAWQLAEVVTALYLHHRHLGEWQEVLRTGAAAAARDGRPDAEARLRSMLSRPLLDLGQDDEARTQLERALLCAELSGHLLLRASVQEFWGRYLERHDLERAQEAFVRCLELSEQAGEPRGAALALLFLGGAQSAAGRGAAAVATLEQAVAGLQACGDARMTARAIAARGRARIRTGEVGAAAADLAAAADRLCALDATHYEAQARVELADLLEAGGSADAEVRFQLERAWQVHRDGGSPQAAVLRTRLDALPPTADSGPAADGGAVEG
ncbi:hypothetical protein [Streptacidiphilus cavernicola]|uniref:NB-ARC domain-containing protein n=1 Tax=Streptacidiphilus cavernicola TaxID=3342716 RepID=A0ABV6VWH0_9ACTN